MARSWLLACIAAVSILLAVPIGGLADQPDSAAPKQPPLPKMKVSKGIYYPLTALRDGLEGTVVIGFDIAANGRASNIALISADAKVFEQPSLELLKSATFELPKGNDGQDIREARYRFGLVFCLPPSSLDDTFPMRALPIVVSSTRIPGSPVRNPPAADATGQCAKVK
jgi:TonB family protein